MIRVAWFSPISTQTGIAQYSRNVLEEVQRLMPKDRIEVIVFHPATSDTVVEMPYPTIELSDSLIRSDLPALYDIAIYHLGNNEKNHGPIYAAMRKHPGIVVLHDYVYQHYLAGVSAQGGYVGPSFGGLVHTVAGMPAFDFLADSGVLKTDEGNVLFVPWDGQWGCLVPMGDRLARLGTAAIVHSDYARTGLGTDFAGPALQLFMPRPDEPKGLGPIAPEGSRIHIVCGGHIGSTKGLRLLTAAFAADPSLKTQFRVTIAGFGSDKPFLRLLEADIRESGLSSCFELRVDPDDDAFAAVMATADVFYNLRYPNTEGASLSLVEQLAHHRPVIAYRSGCFAEVPAEACFFLDKIGDVSELAAQLGHIARNRKELRTRGEAAWNVVRDATASKYAKALVDFLEAHQKSLRARAGLVQARAQGGLPQPKPEDKAWLQAYVSTKILLDEFYEHRSVLPPGFAANTLEEKGRYLAYNLLHVRVNAATARAIGTILEQNTGLALYELVGKLLTVSEGIVFGRALLSGAAEALALPIRDPAFWRILLLLPSRMSVVMAFKALALPYDAVPEVTAAAEADGFGPALAEHLRLQVPEIAEQVWFAPLMLLLQKDRVAEKLMPLPPQADIVDLLRQKSPHKGLRVKGFHPVEPIGIWTASDLAMLRIQVDSALPARQLELSFSMLSPDHDVEIQVLEELTQRTETLALRYDDAVTGQVSCTLDLPEFSGSLQISLMCDSTCSPASLDLSADDRELGLLIASLKLLRSLD